jgi:hypothetical protein
LIEVWYVSIMFSLKDTFISTRPIDMTEKMEYQKSCCTSSSKRMFLRRLIEDGQSIRPNDEILAGRLHHFLRHDRDLVGDQNMFDLHHQTLNEANITSGDAKNGGNGLLIGKIVGIGRHPMTPALIQEKTRLVVGEWLHLVIKPNA